ncbi:MAG: hypothetical protein CMF39_03235 [Legionellaceae bacterium]|nr:hypothetical protein [Legionellaceae bacterium]|tara:strand:- start:460 stop:873 length:414 start_codon:yes stop_codon:yes gene_type:complete
MANDFGKEGVLMNDDKIWVQLETNKGTNHVNSYRGYLHKSDLELWFNNDVAKKRYITLHNAYWVENEVYLDRSSGGSLSDDGMSEGRLATFYRVMGADSGAQYEACSGVIHLLVEHVVMVYVLKNGSEWEAAKANSK